MDFLDISSIEGSQTSMYNSIEDHGREVLVLTIDIGNGKTDEIVIREHDTPKFIAKEFCRKHKLNPEANKVLIEVIKQHIYVKPVIEVSMNASQQKREEQAAKHLESFKPKEELKTKSENLKSEKGKSETGKSEKVTIEFDQSKVSKSSIKPNCGERLYNMGLAHKEKHEKKITEMRQKLNKEKMKDSTFRPSIIPERQMPRLQLLQSESPPKPVDRCHLLYNRSLTASSPVQSPPKFVPTSPATDQKVVNSRKNLQHFLEQREEKERKDKRPFRSKSPAMMTRDRVRKSCRSQSQDLKVKLSNEQTNKIINRIKTIRFVQLFEILNPNENQLISKRTVSCAKIPRIVNKILSPFLDELDNMVHGLNLEQFCKVMDLYIKELTPEERKSLLLIGKRKPSKSGNRNEGSGKELVNDLWSPKHEEKLLVFEHFAEY